MNWLLFQIRWWRWFWGYAACWPMRDLYFGPSRPGRDSRRIMIQRAERSYLLAHPEPRKGGGA